jgi:phosphoribosyl 1,2-cyclic phosphodiesterase
MNRLRFLSLSSGSSGNCYFIGTGKHGILVDAGIGVRTIKKKLKEFGYGIENILGVFVTHDHFDHIKSVGVLGEKYHVPIFSTAEILDGINQNYGVTEKLYTNKKVIEKNQQVSVCEFNVTPFSVSHDGTDNIGYTIEYQGLKFTLATDLGYICEDAAPHIQQANYLVIEANFDKKMLEDSHYPEFLRNRISGQKGHLCNEETANFLAQHYHDGLRYIYLCHLSKQNNTPEKAFDTVKEALEQKGIDVGKDVSLVVLPRTTSSEFYIFD